MCENDAIGLSINGKEVFSGAQKLYYTVGIN